MVLRIAQSILISVTVLAAGCDDNRPTNAVPPTEPRVKVKVGLLQIELPSVRFAVRRLNRIGADWDFVAPGTPFSELQEFDVLWMPSGWGSAFGVADLKSALSKFIETGGGVVFMEPDVDGDFNNHAALNLLPHPVTICQQERSGAGGVAYRSDRPNGITVGIARQELPRAHDQFVKFDEHWTPISWSLNKKAKFSQKLPTVLCADSESGRACLIADTDDDLHEQHLSDRFVSRTLAWLAGHPPQAVKYVDRLGRRKYSKNIQQLHDDCEKLLAKESLDVRRDLKRVEDLMSKRIKLNSVWGHQYESLELMRKHRSLATVAVGLKLLADETINNWHFKEDFCQVFRMHTGHRLTDDNPDQLPRIWWPENRSTLSVNMDKMTPGQLRVVFGELPFMIHKLEPYSYKRTPPFSAKVLEEMLSQKLPEYSKKCPGLLDAKLVPLMYDACRNEDLRWQMTGPLAVMYKSGRLPELSEIVEDGSRNECTRLVAAVVIHRAGGKPPFSTLVDLYRGLDTVESHQVLLPLIQLSEHPAARDFRSELQ